MAIETEKTYDSVFWTGIVKMKRFFAPLVNEVFGEHFTEAAEVVYKPMKNEVQKPDKSISRRDPDSIAEISENGHTKRYHFECQTWSDNSIAIRIAEYATSSAYMEIKETPEGARIEIPNSAVIVLHSAKSEKKERAFKIDIAYPEGMVSYRVPMLFITDYDVNEIFEKKLFVLLPFIGFLYVRDFKKYEKDPNGVEQLRGIVSDISSRLDVSIQNGELAQDEAGRIMDLMERVFQKLTVNYERIEKEVDYIMGGEIIKTRTDIALEKGEKKGRKSLLIDLVQSGDLPIEKAAEKLGVTVEKFEKYLQQAK